MKTVLGEVDVGEITGVLPHEHLLSLVPGPWLNGGPTTDEGDQAHLVDLGVSLLDGLPAAGFNLVVDLSPYGVVGRDEEGGNVSLLGEISRRSGVHIVLGTSIYLEAFSPKWLRSLSRAELADLFVKDLSEGMGATQVRAAVIGEQATGLGEISEFERRCMLAACDAHKETEAPIFTHTTHGSMALEQIAIFDREGIPLDRVVVGHMDIQPDIHYTRRVLDSGAYVAFDTVGKEFWEFFLSPKARPKEEGAFGARFYYRPDESRLDVLEELVQDGFVDQILLSHDLTGAEAYLNPTTHGTWGLRYLADVFLPKIRARGVSDETITALTVANPLRVIAE